MIIFTGCSIKETAKSKSDEEILRDRVMEYWAYKIGGRLDRAYEFEDPSYKKEVGIVSYIKKFNPQMKWLKTEISEISIKDEIASVNLLIWTELKTLDYKAGRKVDIKADRVPVKEQWEKVDGVWYHIQKNFIPSGKKGEDLSGNYFEDKGGEGSRKEKVFI